MSACNIQIGLWVTTQGLKLFLVDQSHRFQVFFCSEELMVINSLVVNLWYSVFAISMVSYYGLETAGVNTVRLSDDTNEFILGFILRDDHI